MEITVIGGDSRSIFLTQLMQSAGHTVRCWGLEQALPCAPSLQDALQGTQAIILPTPATAGDFLRTPYSTASLSAAELLPLLPHVPIFAGAPNAALTEGCAARGLPLTDLLQQGALTEQNAAITAECALGLLITQLPYTLQGEPILVLGAGRIGNRLAHLLHKIGAEVTVATRRPHRCSAEGVEIVNLQEAAPLLSRFRIAINTIPARVLPLGLPQGAVLMELASAPGGFDPQLAADLGYRVIAAGGLPGQLAPESAAKAMWETIESILRR